MDVIKRPFSELKFSRFPFKSTLLLLNIQLSTETFLSPVYTTEMFWHGSGEIGTGSKKKRFSLDKICSVNNLSVPNFIRAEKIGTVRIEQVV